MAPLLFVTVLNPLNSAMLATALLPIGRAFPQEADVGGWLVASLYLTAAIAQPVLGSFADRYGARRTLIGSTLILGLGGLIGALAADMMTLIAARVLIGFGTSSAFPCAVAIIRRRALDAGIDPPARLLGFLSASSAVAVAIGPPLGGLLTEWLGWRAIFSINLPLAVLAFAAIHAAVPPHRPLQGEQPRIDWLGIALFTVSMTALVFFLMHLTDRFDAIALALAGAGTALFVWAERRQAWPFIDLALLRANRPLTLTYGNHIAFNFANYCYFYGMPQWSQTSLGVSLAGSGLMLMPVALSSFFGSLAPTRGRAGALVELCGAAALTFSCAALLLIGERTPVPAILALSLSFGMAFGILNMSNQQRLLDYAPVAQAGSAAGLLRTSAYLGAMLSAPLVSYLFAGNAGGRAMAVLGMMALPISLIAMLTVIVDLRRGRHSLAAAAKP